MPAPRFAPWRAACWLVLLLAAFGGIQYLRLGAWPYLLGALWTVLVCAGCVLRQGWARPLMQATAVLLVVWLIASGGWMLAQLGQFDQARAHALDSAQTAVLVPLIEQAHRSYLVALVLKALGLPLLGWLAWQLGRAPVRAQFAASPGR